MSEISNDFRAKLQAKDPKFYGEGGMFYRGPSLGMP